MVLPVINLGVKADLNSVDGLGVYQAVNCVSAPAGVSGFVFLHVTSANVGGVNRALQKLWNLSSGTEYTRLKTVGGWTPWETGGGGGGGGDYDPLGTADAVMADHLADADPHPQYLSTAEGDARYDLDGAAAAAVVAHVGEADPHTQYLTNLRGDARYEPVGSVAAHVAALDPHPQYLTETRGDARYDADGAADAAVAAHEGEADPHTQYLTNGRGDARYDALGAGTTAAAAAVATHVGAVDPHTQYLNNTRGDARYDLAGTADAAVAAHESESDPHTQYYNQTRGDARYAAIVHTHVATDISDSTTTGRALITAANAAAAKSTIGLANANNTADVDKLVKGVIFVDNRAAALPPNGTPEKSLTCDFKEVAAVDNPPYPATVNYAFIMTVQGWSTDGTSGWPVQINFGSKLSFRQGVSTSAWGAWQTLVTEGSSITKGIAFTVYDAGTKSSGTFTPDVVNSGMQKCSNAGAFTLAPPSADCTMVIDITNSATAGAVTLSGFTKVTGDTMDTTNAHVWRCFISVSGGKSHIFIQAMF